MSEDDQPKDAILPADKSEPEYLGMPLILCKTSRPHSLTRETRITATPPPGLLTRVLTLLGLRKADE